MSSTLVTCYYKVKSKHSHKYYDEWIGYFLNNLNTNIIIFTSNDLVNYLMEKTKNKDKIHIIALNFNDLPIKKKYEKIWDEQYALDPEKHIRTKECYIIWNSKFDFVRQAIELNPFNSDKFVWNDIGSFRNPKYLKILESYPKYEKISKDKIDISLVVPFRTNQDFFFNSIHFGGAIFGGGKDIMLMMANKFYEMFDTYLEKKLFIGCDQQILASLYMKNKELFNCVSTNNFYDKWFELYAYYYLKKME